MALVLSSCSSPKPLSHPSQQKSYLTIETKSYADANKVIEELVSKHEGILKHTVRRNNTEGQCYEADFRIYLNPRVHQEFINDFRYKFLNDIVEEKNQREEISETATRDRLEKQKSLEKSIKELSKRYDGETDDIMRDFYALDMKNKLTELNDLMSDNRVDVDLLRYTNVEIRWRLLKKEAVKQEPEETKLPEKTIPGIQQPAAQPQQQLKPQVLTPPMPNYFNDSPQLNFNDFGEEETFSPNKQITIKIDKTNDGQAAFASTYNDENEEMTIEMVPTDEDEEDVVYLYDKCQTVDIGLGAIPKIVISKNIEKEQIILTPKVDDNCNIIGFELRAGTIESGCINGRDNYNRMKKCFKMNNETFKKKAKQKKAIKKTSKKAATNNERDLLYEMP